MTGIRVKLLAYTLLISAGTIVPLLLMTLPAYSEITGHYRTIMSGQDTLSLSQIRETLQSDKLIVTRLVSLYIGSLAVLIVSGIYLVNRLVIIPVKTLTAGTTQLAKGKYDIQLPIYHHDELGELAESLSILQSNLQATLLRQEQESITLNNMLIELQASEARSKGVFNSVQDGLIITDGLGVIKTVNPALCKITGYSQSELLDNNVDILIPKSYRSKHQQKMLDFALDTSQSRHSLIQVDAHCKDGINVPVEIGLTQFTVNDKPHLIGVVHDISDRKRAEKALLYERDRAQSYLDTAAVAILSINTDGIITLVNRKCCELLGFSETELLGQDYFALCPDRDVAEEMYEAFRLHVTNNEAFPKFFYINLKSKDGQTRIFEWHNNTTKDNESKTTGIILAGMDMTEFRKSIDERNALRDRLHQAQKMQAIGQLSSGIAHDFNNLLASMMGYTELLQDILPDDKDESVQGYLKEIYASGERARDLIEGMLKYSRGDGQKANGSTEKLYVPFIADDLSNILRGILPGGVEVSINMRQDAYPVYLDSIDLQQVIMNLSLNASDAMHKNGSFFINSENRPSCRGICTSCGKSFSGDFLELSFSDTGVGIEAESIAHLFEPFYTTKIIGEVGKGAGMGLAVVHGIIHEAGGHIIVESKPGVGSTFRVLIPAAAEQSEAQGCNQGGEA